MDAIIEAVTDYSSQINYTTEVYNPNNDKIPRFKLFDNEDKKIEYLKVTTKVNTLYLRGNSNANMFAYFDRNSSELIKERVDNQVLEHKLVLKDETPPNTEDIEVHFIFFGYEEDRRILSVDKLDVYISDEEIADDEIFVPTSSTQYFLYIGLPIIILALIILVVVVVICVKKRKKAAENNEEKGISAKKDSGITQNNQMSTNQMSQHTDNKLESNMEQPVMNNLPANGQPQVMYGMPPQGSNMPYPVIYVMPGTDPNQLPMGNKNMQSGMPNFLTSNQTRSTGLTNNLSNMGSNMPSNMPSNNLGSNMTPQLMSGMPNHYDARNTPFGGEQGGNNLKMFDATEMPEDSVPMFEVNMKGVDEYTPGQKFQ